MQRKERRGERFFRTVNAGLGPIFRLLGALQILLQRGAKPMTVNFVAPAHVEQKNDAADDEQGEP